MNFNFDNPYLSTRAPLFARNVVSTSHPLAAQAGLQMLRQGGNAVDAAVAAAAAMTIVEPVSNGLGSDAFALVWDGQGLQGLNASGRAPQAWTPDYFTRKYGAGAVNPPKRGLDAVTVPGAVSAWVGLSERFGKLPFADLMAPAIDIAERGYLVTPVIQQKWAAPVAELQGQPGFAAAFLPYGRAPRSVNCSGFRLQPAACVPLRLQKVKRSMVARSPRRWSAWHWCRAPVCALATWPVTARSGSPRSAGTTAATPCTRSRPMGRALPH